MHGNLLRSKTNKNSRHTVNDFATIVTGSGNNRLGFGDNASPVTNVLTK